MWSCPRSCNSAPEHSWAEYTHLFRRASNFSYFISPPSSHDLEIDQVRRHKEHFSSLMRTEGKEGFPEKGSVRIHSMRASFMNSLDLTHARTHTHMRTHTTSLKNCECSSGTETTTNLKNVSVFCVNRASVNTTVIEIIAHYYFFLFYSSFSKLMDSF